MVLELPDREVKVFWYLGVDDNLAQGGQGNLDLDDAIEFVAVTNAYAPAGIGGEAIFVAVRIALFRDNDEDMELDIIPIVDGTEEEEITLTLPGVTDPARSIHELQLVRYYPSSADPQIVNSPRGTWFQLDVRSVGPPESIGRTDGRVVIEGVELEYEIVREGVTADNAD